MVDIKTAISVICALAIVAVIVGFSSQTGSNYVSWAYHIGDQPIYRIVFLVVVLIVSMHSFPVALMLVLLYMMITSMVPLLSELDETFVFGPPLTDCKAYDKKLVQEVGTPFYPMTGKEPPSHAPV